MLTPRKRDRGRPLRPPRAYEPESQLSHSSSASRHCGGLRPRLPEPGLPDTALSCWVSPFRDPGLLRAPLWSSVPTSQPVACNSRSLLSERWRWGNGSGKAAQLALFRWSTKLSVTSLLEPLSLHPFLPGGGGWHLLCLKEPSSLVLWAPHVKE